LTALLASHIFGDPWTSFIGVNVLLIISHVNFEGRRRSQLLKLLGSADFYLPILAEDALFDAVKLALDDGSVVVIVLFADSADLRFILSIDTLLY